MTEFTPNYKIPYPVPTDPIWQGAGQMKVLAGTVDKVMKAVEDSSPKNATAAPTANTFVKRDAYGRAQIASPTANADIANMAYVDSVGASVEFRVDQDLTALDSKLNAEIDATENRVNTYVSRVDDKLGGLIFKKSTTVPPVGTADNVITFVVS